MSQNCNKRLTTYPNFGKEAALPPVCPKPARKGESEAVSPPPTTHFLRQIVRVKVLQGNSDQALWDVPIDERQTLPGFQVTVGLGLAVLIVVPVAAISLWWFLKLALGNAPLDVCQRLGGERLETIRAWWCEQPPCHLLILQQLR